MKTVAKLDAILGKRLKEFRLARSLTRKQLGEMIGIDPQTIYFWESARHKPSLDTIRHLNSLPIGKHLVQILMSKGSLIG